MLATQPDCTIELPFAGSRGFERLTARPITVLQLRPDGRALVRRDDVARPSPHRAGDARGNATLPLNDLFDDAKLAAQGDRRRSAARKVRGL
ncbi:hypothetical protein ACRAQ6_14100 [Erythrobacter sp. HA6-11]